MAQVPFLVTTDLSFSVLASIYNQLEKEEAWKRGTPAKDIMLRLDISFLYCLFSLPTLPVVPTEIRNISYLSLLLSCEHSPSLGAGFCFYFSFSLVFLCLVSSLVCPCAFGCWTHLAGFSGPMVVVAFSACRGCAD